MKLRLLRVTFLRASKIHVCDVIGHTFVTLKIKTACQLHVYPQVATLLRACVDSQADMERVVLKKSPPVVQELN
jgi:hypothetical protein